MATNPSTVISTPVSGQLSGLARQSAQHHLLDEAAALKAMEQARKENLTLVTYLVENKLARDKDIARIAARSFNLPLFDLEALDIDPTTGAPGRCEATAPASRPALVQTRQPSLCQHERSDQTSARWRTSSFKPGLILNRSSSAKLNSARCWIPPWIPRQWT